VKKRLRTDPDLKAALNCILPSSLQYNEFNYQIKQRNADEHLYKGYYRCSQTRRTKCKATMILNKDCAKGQCWYSFGRNPHTCFTKSNEMVEVINIRQELDEEIERLALDSISIVAKELATDINNRFVTKYKGKFSFKRSLT
jgi:hypothetical protein